MVLRSSQTVLTVPSNVEGLGIGNLQQRSLTVYVDCFSVIAREDFVQKFISAVIVSMGKNVAEGNVLQKTMKVFMGLRIPSLPGGAELRI
jgi:hypothetical protein